MTRVDAPTAAKGIQLFPGKAMNANIATPSAHTALFRTNIEFVA